MIDIQKECENRFKKEQEYLGTNKLINQINPLVSVTVTTYQHAAYIKDCLEGILMQKTNFPFEIIIGEDESTDGTREICIEYAEKYPDKIRLFLRNRETSQLYDENGKFVKRFNGLWTRMSARGKYIALCEGDDYWTDPLKLQIQVNVLEKHPQYVFCCHRFKRYIQNEGVFENDFTSDWYENNENYEIDTNILFNIWPTSTLTMMIRKNAVYNASKNTQNFKHSMDVHFFYYLLKEGKGISINRIMAVYRVHEGGISSGLNRDKFITKAYLVHKELHEANRHEESLRKKYFTYLIRMQTETSQSFRKKMRIFKEGLNAYKGRKELLSLMLHTIKGILPAFVTKSIINIRHSKNSIK